jgi:hypothetical protein
MFRLKKQDKYDIKHIILKIIVRYKRKYTTDTIKFIIYIKEHVFFKRKDAELQILSLKKLQIIRLNTQIVKATGIC